MKKWLIVSSSIILGVTLLASIYYFFVLDYLITPTLALKGEPNITISLNEVYQEPGFITKKHNKVKIDGIIDNKKIGEYMVEYHVKNAKGRNEIIKKRTVIVIDQDKPVINLDGDQIITLYQGSKYQEPGFKAIDNYDGDITNNVVVSNQVDINHLGNYLVSYQVKDSSGNETVVNRTINVVQNNVVTTSIPILMYHFFYDSSKGEKAKDANYTEINTFDAEIKYLVDNGYYFPSWTEIEQYLNCILTLPNKSIVITIDDGNESFFRLAYPVLKKYNVKATSFLVTSWTNPSGYDLDRNLISFESHSNDMHKGGCSTKHGGLMQCIDYAAGYQDLITSKDILGSNQVFCYPFGDYNDHTKRLLKDTGYKMAVTTEYGKIKPGMDKLQLPRIRIQGYYNLAKFIEVIK